MINEAWTHEDITKAYLSIDGYELISRKDREDTSLGRGGGLLIYKANGLVASEIPCSTEFNQVTAVSVSSKPNPLTINLVYRSPNSRAENNHKLDAFIKEIGPSTIIIGDMNYGGIDWVLGSANTEGRCFFDATQDVFLEQHVHFPTHEGSVLDLVLASNDVQVVSVEDVGNLGKSKHSILQIAVNSKPIQMPTTQKVPDHSKADYSKLRDMMTVDWPSLFTDLNASDCWTILREKLDHALLECIPLKCRRNNKTPLWMNRNIMRMIRKKRRMWKWYKTTKEYSDYQAYLTVQKSVTKVIRSARRTLERKLAKNVKKNPRQFYSHLNKHTKSRVQVGPLLNTAGEQVADSQGMCNILNGFFTSVFTTEDLDNLPSPTPLCYSKIGSLTITEEMFKKQLSKTKQNGAPGPDIITTKVLNELKDIISEPLCIIFNKSLATGDIPEDWRTAHVTPVFKKGSRLHAENYRPISLTSIVCKILESMITREIVSYLSSNKLLNSSQHGFVTHRSCLTNLLEYLETLTKLLDEGHMIDVFYLDFSKAFDRVPHQRLLSKLKAHGIDGDIFNWIRSWLSNRKQSVVLNGCQSNWTKVPSGVPQGSVLGPLLFVIYINDIDTAVDTVHCLILKYADDTKGLRVVDTEEQAELLQIDLDNLSMWSVEWQMLFNIDKCHILHFGAMNPCREYQINGHPLKHVDYEKDLGVLIDSTCTPSRQVTAAALKGNQALGQLLRAFTYRDRGTYIKLYKQYVRPHLESCVQAWSPWAVINI